MTRSKLHDLKKYTCIKFVNFECTKKYISFQNEFCRDTSKTHLNLKITLVDSD